MLKKFLVVLIVFSVFALQLQAWSWNTPEEKAKKYLSELKKMAENAKELDEIGWSPRANILMKKLQKLGHPAVQPMMDEMLDKNNDWKFRFVCIDLLHGVSELNKEEGEKIVKSYIKLLWDDRENEILRGRSAHALERIGVTREAHLLSEKETGVKLQPNIWPEILPPEIREKIVDTLIALSLDENAPNSIRISTIGALSTYCDFANKIINSISPLLNSSNDGIRASVVNTLGGIGIMAERERIGKILLNELMKDKRGLVSDQILFWIKRLKIREAIPILIESLRTGKYCNKAAAAEILGKMKVKEALPDLIFVLKTGKPYERYIAAEALGNIGSKEAVEPLIGALGGSDPSITKKAAEALGEIGDSRAIAPLMKIFKDANRYQVEGSKEIIWALKSLGVSEQKLRELKQERRKEYPKEER